MALAQYGGKSSDCGNLIHNILSSLVLAGAPDSQIHGVPVSHFICDQNSIMKKKNQTTIYDIAKAVGYSPATVSLALNDKGSMPDQRRNEIKATAKKMGYVPNLVAMALKGVKTKHIGIVINYLDNAFFRNFFEGIEETLDKEGYTYSVSQTKDNLEKEKQYIQKLARQNVDGIVLLPASNEYAHLDDIVEQGVPVILISHHLGKFPALEADNVKGAQMIAEHLLSLNYPNNVHIAGPLDKTAIQDRLNGYLSVMKGQPNFSADKNIFNVDSLSAQNGYDVMPSLLKQFPAPVAIFVTNDEVAMGVLKYCREHQLRIPEDVAVAGFSNTNILDLYGIELTTVNIPQKEMGQSAMKLIMQLLDNETYNKDKNPVITLPVDLIVRGSTVKK